ncbi:MAG TPA: glycosyltransferase family 39 protein [Candidatus Woesebacteria bacterium]|nr:glycosyltransferase family 39 protein [Candidatus Woesebacteria bacterium]
MKILPNVKIPPSTIGGHPPLAKEGLSWRIHRRDVLILILILIVSAFFRLYRIDGYMEFLGDQGRDAIIIRDFLKHGNLFFIGPPTSIGHMYLGPYYYYLISPFLWLFNFNPVGLAVFVAILGVATTYLFYFVGSRWFNRAIGLTAAFLFAISPVAIKYNTFSWNPNVMPFFALLFVYCLIEKKYIWASLAFIGCLNSHYFSLALLPLAGLYWLINYKKDDLKPTIAAIIIFLISLTPQILFDLKHQGTNAQAFKTFFTQRETTVSILPYKAVPKLFPTINNINSRLIYGKNTTIAPYLTIVWVIFLIYGICRFKDKKVIWLSLWLLIGATAFALYKNHIYDHYYGFIVPAVFLLTAYLINKIKMVGIPLGIIIVTLSLIENPLRYPPNNQLKTTRAIDELIIQDANQQEFNFALLSKMNYADPYLYFFEGSKLVDTHTKITDQLYVVCEPFQIDCQPINNPEWGIASFGWAKIDKQWEINGIKIFRLVHNK